MEFTPGQKIQKAPAAAACAAAQRGACGRAHRDAPRPDVHRLHDADRRAGRRPRGQHAGLYGAYNAVRPQRRPAPAPVQPAAPVQTSPRRMPMTSRLPLMSLQAKHDGTGQWPVPPPVGRRGHAGQHADREHPPDADRAPEHSGYTQNSASGTALSAPAHSGFTQRIDMPAAPASGSQAPAPAHTGFYPKAGPGPGAACPQRLHPEPRNQQASAAPDTASFVNGIAAAINTQQPAGIRAIMTALRRG